MTSFLSPERQAKLVAKLQSINVPQNIIDKFTNIPDDLDRVDEIMTLHVLAVAKCRNDGQDKTARVGLLFLANIMAEAIERGLTENDFPASLMAIKADLAKGKNIQ